MHILLQPTLFQSNPPVDHYSTLGRKTAHPDTRTARCVAANSEVDLIMHQDDKGESTGGVIFIPPGQMCSIIMQ